MKVSGEFQRRRLYHLTSQMSFNTLTGAFVPTPNGRIVRLNHLMAKLSRPEVAAEFMAPAPERIVNALVREGRLTPSEIEIALRSRHRGGRYQRKPTPAGIQITATSCRAPAAASARTGQGVCEFARCSSRVRGRGGRMNGTPGGAVAAAFTMGAAYVLTGTINQTARESGLSEAAEAHACLRTRGWR